MCALKSASQKLTFAVQLGMSAMDQWLTWGHPSDARHGFWRRARTKSIRQQQELVMGRILNSTVTGMSHRKNKNGKNAELLRFFPTVARPS